MTLRVNPIKDGDDYEFISYNIEGKLSGWAAYDIFLMDFGVTVSPTSEVKVYIPVPAGADTEKLAVYAMSNDGTATRMEVTVEDGMAAFTTKQLGLFVVGEGIPGADDGGNSEIPPTGERSPLALCCVLGIASIAVLSLQSRKFKRAQR